MQKKPASEEAGFSLIFDLFVAVEIQTEQTGFVIRILADDIRFADIAPVDAARQREKLRQLTLEVEDIALRRF